MKRLQIDYTLLQPHVVQSIWFIAGFYIHIYKQEDEKILYFACQERREQNFLNNQQFYN